MIKPAAALGCVLSLRYLRKQRDATRKNRANQSLAISGMEANPNVILGTVVDTTGEETARV